jgi:hypothetical protein
MDITEITDRQRQRDRAWKERREEKDERYVRYLLLT